MRVAEPHGAYSGETKFPLIIQNVHRYFWYAAVAVGAVLSFDVVLAFRDADHEWGHMGLGTVLMLVNVALIWLYTLSCHSCRHITGGRLRHFSKHPVRYKAVDLGLEAQRQPRALRLAVAVLRGARRPLHLGPGRRLVRRPAVLLRRLTDVPRT